MTTYAVRDRDGRFLARARSMVAAHRASRSRDRVGSTVSRNRAGVEVGMTAFGPLGLKVHHYRGSVRITDMTNAGRRGKKVRELAVVARTMSDDAADEMFVRVIDAILHMDYDGAKAYLAPLADRGDFTMHEQLLRGVDVEPPATKINLSKTHPDGTILTISASPHDFHVRNSVVYGGKAAGKEAFRQDTGYWPSGSEAQKRRSAGVFYDWLKRNLQSASNMTIRELTTVWNSLGVSYNEH